MAKLTLFTKTLPPRSKNQYWRTSRNQGFFIDSLKAGDINPFFNFTPFIASVESHTLTKEGKGSVQICCNPDGTALRPHNMYQKEKGKITVFFQVPSLWECIWAFIEGTEIMTFQKVDSIEYKTLIRLGEDIGMQTLQKYAKDQQDKGRDIEMPEVPASAATWRAIEHLLFKKPALGYEGFKEKGPENWKEIIAYLKSKKEPKNKGDIVYANLSNWKQCPKCHLYIKADRSCTCKEEDTIE